MDYYELIDTISDGPLAPLIDSLPVDFPEGYRHGDLPEWLNALDNLPAIEPASFDLGPTVRVGEARQCTESMRDQLRRQLLRLQPWRKGPFDLFGLSVDTEWRSDWKWNRLKDHITPLEGRTVLDVGCGNGYHCWRMAGAGARLVIGADGHLLFVMQYWAIRHFLRPPPVHVVPLTLEQLPAGLKSFDTVFSMGVLYHRRSPVDHLSVLRDCLRPGGELVLETLVIDGEEGMTLMPRGRYARMPNVWFIPSCATLETWLAKCGFEEIRLVDVSTTSVREQRSTPWMTFDSLARALDPDDPGRTIEGYPAPRRAIMVARKRC